MGRHALLLGAATFSADKTLENLPGVHRDVDQLQAVLDESGRFDSLVARVDLGRDEMVAEIDRFYAQRRTGDLALLYYSGHGLLDPDGTSLFLATADSTVEGPLAVGSIDADGFLRHCLNSTNASQRVVLLDCCYSGAFELRNRFQGGVRQESRRGILQRGTFVMSATDHLHAAKSQGPDRPSIFTAAVLDALRGQGTPTDDGTWVTTSDLTRHVRATMGRFKPSESSEGVTEEIKLVEIDGSHRDRAVTKVAPTASSRSEAELDTDHWRRLIDYYTSCLQRGAELSSFVPLTSRSTYVTVSGFESVFSGTAEGQPAIPAYAEFRKRHAAADCQFRYGYPLLILAEGKGGKGRRFAPLLVSDVTISEQGKVLASPPGFNRAIGAELRLSEPELDDLERQVEETFVAGDRSSLVRAVQQLMGILDLKTAGPMDPGRLSGAVAPTPVDRVQNAAVLYVGDPSGGAQGSLLKDLEAIRQEPTKISGTALAVLADGAAEGPSQAVTIVAPDRLNEAQEHIIRSAMNQRLTVAQGPPGTGKSQLVAALVATASAAGQSVLVGSTNNRAVDEVVDRIRNKLGPGLLMRTGRKEYLAAEPEILQKLLASMAGEPADEQTPAADVRLIEREIAELRAGLDSRRRVERDLAELAVERAQLEPFDLPDGELVRMIGWAQRAARGGLLAWWWRRRLRASGWQPQEQIDDLVFRLVVEGRWRAGQRELTVLPDEASSWQRLTQLIGADRPQAGRRLLAAKLVNRIRSGRPALETRISNMSQSTPQTWPQFPRLLSTLPAWATTSMSARRLKPDPGLFDLVIIDEAAQCTVPAVLPMIYRARRVLVIGDPHQLSPVVTLPAAEEKIIQERSGLAQEWLGNRRLSYTGHSAYDAFAAVASSVFLLDEHYRCRPGIVAAPNRVVYQGKLTVLTAQDKLGGASVDWRHVPGSFEHGSSNSGRNRVEAAAVVDEVRRLRALHPGASIGVVTPLAAQARDLNRALDALRADPDDIVCGTIHRYQGGEQDIMVVSPVGAGGIQRPTQNWLVNQTNLWNVAITRARSRLIVVGDQDWWSGQRGLLPQLLRPTDEGPATGESYEALDRLQLEFRQAGADIARSPMIDGRRYDFALAGRIYLKVDDPADDSDGRSLRKVLAAMDLCPPGSEVIRIPLWRCLSEPERVVQEVLARSK
ncbi:AAA domain-containing protein [Kribbella sp. NPDC020789]